MTALSKPTPLAVFERSAPLIAGTLVKRYKRFLSDIELDDGELVVAHCVNTGAMEGLTRPGTRVWLSASDNPKRKLGYTWELAEIDGQILGVNTGLPNRMVHKLLLEKRLPWLSHWDGVRPEKKYGINSRVDFWLTEGDKQHFLEVKNCHLIYPDKRAYFPDCVSTRASGHLEELVHCAESNCGNVTAEVLFFVQMPGAECVRPSDLHDQVFATTSRAVAARGVKFSAIGLHHTPTQMIVYGPMPVDLDPYSTEDVELWRSANRIS